MQKTLQFKELTELSDIQEVVNLQLQTWGEEVLSSLPQLVAASRHGGSVIGVFDHNKVIGFCYGFPGISKLSQNPYLVSHMMAIHPDYRNQKLGEQLKFCQREWALLNGYEKIIWTFDPLELRNGYLNVTKLGGCVRTYIQSYYGQMEDKLNKGIPSDRFLLEWNLNSSTVRNAVKGEKNIKEHWQGYDLFLDYSMRNDIPVPLENNIMKIKKGILVPVPKEIQQIKAVSFDITFAWRIAVRNATQHLFEQGFSVKGVLIRDNMGFYVFEK